jgi:ribonucleoside-triphosphate reductase
MIELSREVSLQKPLINPKLILGIESKTFEDDDRRAVLLRAHMLAADTGLPYFVIGIGKDGSHSQFSSSGVKFEADLTGDWEADTLRTGCLGVVTINLPRIAIESGKDKNRFLELLRERFELSARALGIKYTAFRQHGKTLLPFLTQSKTGDPYLGLESCSRIIDFVGFWESLRALSEKEPYSEASMMLSQEIVQAIVSSKQKLSRKYGKRLYPALLPNSEASERLARMDIETFGIAKVQFSGNRERPFYSTIKRLHMKASDPPFILSEEFEPFKKLRSVSIGGGLNIINLDESDYRPEALLDLTRRLVQDRMLELFTYNRNATYCTNCKKSWIGNLHKCPSCGAISTMAVFDRFSNV